MCKQLIVGVATVAILSLATTWSQAQQDRNTPTQQDQNTPTQQDQRVHVEVLAPPDAEIWFFDQPTQQRGPDRFYISPPIEPNHNYYYEVKARWMQNGTPVERSKKVDVQPGQQVRVDFMNDQGNTAAQSQQRPNANQKQQPATNSPEQQSGANANQDRDRIVGNWTVVSGEDNGKPMPAEKVKGSRVTISKDNITVHEENQKRVMSYKLSQNTTPKQIDLTTVEGSEQGKTSQGIYSLDGDNLKISFGQERPKDFATKEGSKDMTFVMKRAANR
jgi:uncharacterized protein (TIGR03067 family)/uncharacterized protein (TIGR03000 family)